MKRNIENAMIGVILAVGLFMALFPYVWLILTSFKTDAESISIPPTILAHPTLANYEYVIFQEGVGILFYMKNSAIIAAGSVALSLLLGVSAAYAFTRFRFRGSGGLAFWILSTRMGPPMGIIVPIFLLWKFLDLYDTLLGMILVYTMINVPFVVWMMKGYFQEIPKEIEEAAMADGCSRLMAFRKIMLPLALPGLVATGVFCLLVSWNEFFFALLLTGTVARTAPVAITSSISTEIVRWGEMCASSTLVLIPVLVCFAYVQKHFVRGLTLGAVRG